MSVEDEVAPEKKKPARSLMDRSATDLLVLMLAGTICFIVLGSGLTLMISGLLHPETEHNAAVALVADTLQMLISLLAGFLAGRTDANRITKPPDNV